MDFLFDFLYIMGSISTLCGRPWTHNELAQLYTASGCQTAIGHKGNEINH